MTSAPLSVGSVEPEVARRTPLWQDLLVTVGSIGLLLGGIVGLSLLLGRLVIEMPAEFLRADLDLYRRILGMSTPGWTNVVLTLLNDPGLDYSVVVAACLGYAWWKRRQDMPAAAVALGLTLIIGAWTIPYTQTYGLRPRPFLVATDVTMNDQWRQIWAAIPSFPSGHVRELTGLCVVLVYFWRRAAWLAVPYVAVVAFSRVYIGAHYPTDVAGALLIGGLSGTLSVVGAHQGRKLILALARASVVRRSFAYVFHRPAGTVSLPILALLLRTVITLGLILAGAFALGFVIYIKDPRILADYLLNTDHSLAYPLMERFHADSASLVHWLFADLTKTVPALALGLLILGGVRNGWKGLGKAAVAILLAYVLAQIVVAVFGTHFARPRPFTTIEAAPPAAWQQRWSGTGTFPDLYLLLVTALCAALAREWHPISIPAYVYPFLAAISVVYFGAVWPTDALGSLIVGYWVGVLALLLADEASARLEVLGNDDPQRARDG